MPGAGPRLGVVAAPAHLEDGLLARPVHALDLGDLRRDVLEELAVGLSPDVQPGIFALFEVGSELVLALCLTPTSLSQLSLPTYIGTVLRPPQAMKLLLAFLVLGVGLAADCPMGKYKAPSGSCIFCPKNSNTGDKTGSTSKEGCVANPGYFGANGGTPTACPDNSNTGDKTGSTSKEACVANPGFYGKNGFTPTACPVDTFKNKAGAAECTACPTNMLTGGKTGSDASTACVVGVSAWTTCTCDLPSDNRRTKLVAGKEVTETRPCELDKPCAGVAEAESWKVATGSVRSWALGLDQR